MNPNGEMSFVDHLEELRWHIARSLLVWLAAAILIFIYIDFVYDQIIYAPAQSDFVTYIYFCKFGHMIGLGDGLCMPPVNIALQGITVSGPFMSALNIAMVGGIVLAFPYLFWELWRFIKPALSPKVIKSARGSIFWVSLCFFSGAAFGYYLLAPFTFFLSTRAVIITLNSYNNNKGKETIAWLVQSGEGVITAATIKIITTAYLR